MLYNKNYEPVEFEILADVVHDSIDTVVIQLILRLGHRYSLPFAYHIV